MECLAHQAHKLRSHFDPASLDAVKQAVEIDSQRRFSGAAWPEDPAKNLRRSCSQDRMPHVCVIGAGLAGMRCARKLYESGCQVTILEARDRVGGRVYQEERTGVPMDMGPNWIHGSEENPILALSQGLSDVLYEPPQDEDVDSPVYDASGLPVDTCAASKYSAIAWQLIDQAMKHSEAEGSSISPEVSLADFLREALRSKGYTAEKTWLIMGLADMWSNIVGEPMEQQSLKYLWLEKCIEGENWYLASTYRSVLAQIHDGCKETVEIQLKTKVTEIVQHDSHDGQKSAISVRVEDGRILQYDEIVVTAPLGWLKHNKHAFKPSLPVPLEEAIDHIGYGRLEKVYITFNHAFWETDNTPSLQPFIFRFLEPDYAYEHNPDRRTLECVSLAALPPNTRQNTLLFYLNGPTSEYVTRLVRGLEPGSKQRHAKFVEYFSPYYSKLRNYDTSYQPVDFCSTDWQNDELAGFGSYSTYQVSKLSDGPVELDKDIERLRIGCPERNLWFAGEHTAPTLALGTTTGAYWSGEAVAERLCSVYEDLRFST